MARSFDAEKLQRLRGTEVGEYARGGAGGRALERKAEVSKALKDSFAYCADALQKMTDEKAVSSAQISTALLHVVVHNNEIYGNIVGYLRVNGIVPPSTAARAGQEGKKN
jgi:hypothetical protein